MTLPTGQRADPRAATDEQVAALDLPHVYQRWFDDVVRWCRALGAPESEVEDIVQDVFLVVRRRLSGFDGHNLPAWLYTITARTVSARRRSAFFRRLWSRRDHEPLTSAVDPRPGPLEQLEKHEARRLVARLLDGMSEKRRVAFMLFELEGYTGAELAALLGVPEKTIWTRLFHARKEFVARYRDFAAAQEDE